MKIMFIVTGLQAGGAEMMLYKILSRLDRVCFTSEVVNLSESGPVQQLIESIGIPVCTLGLSSPWDALRGISSSVAPCRRVCRFVLSITARGRASPV